MFRMKQTDAADALAEPIALTPDQVEEIAGTTAVNVGAVAGGLSLIRAGGITPEPVYPPCPSGGTVVVVVLT